MVTYCSKKIADIKRAILIGGSVTEINCYVNAVSLPNKPLYKSYVSQRHREYRAVKRQA